MVCEASSVTPSHNPEGRLIEPAIERVLLALQNLPLASGHHENRTPTHGYAATRETAMAAFAKSWRRE
jgi:hypothetical protein